MTSLFIVPLLLIEVHNFRKKKKKQHLQIFSKKLFVQGETLDNALITGVESPQLYPLAGGVSADRTRDTSDARV